MSVASKRNRSILKMVQLSILLALVLVIHFLGIGIPLPFLATPISLVLIPVALGAMLLGPAAGAALGFVYGLVIYLTLGVMHMDFFTGFLFDNNPFITAGICLVKTTLAGFLAGWVYKLVKDKKPLLAVFLAAGIVPVVNTGVFVLGCLVILGTIESFIATAELAQSAVYFIFIGCAGINFIFEFIVNMIFSPALQRIIHAVTRHLGR